MVLGGVVVEVLLGSNSGGWVGFVGFCRELDRFAG